MQSLIFIQGLLSSDTKANQDNLIYDVVAIKNRKIFQLSFKNSYLALFYRKRPRNVVAVDSLPLCLSLYCLWPWPFGLADNLTFDPWPSKFIYIASHSRCIKVIIMTLKIYRFFKELNMDKEIEYWKSVFSSVWTWSAYYHWLLFSIIWFLIYILCILLSHAKCRSPYNLSTIKKTLSPRTLIFPWLGCRILIDFSMTLCRY